MDSKIEKSDERQKQDGSSHDNFVREFSDRKILNELLYPEPEPDTSIQGQLAAHGTDFLKTTLLFMPMSGKLGKAATVATGFVYGISEMDSSEGVTIDNLGRGAMGMTKGLGTRCALGKIGQAEKFNFAARGLAMSVTARAIDVGCSPSTYWDNGKFSPAKAADRMQNVLLDGKALGTDLLIIGLAHVPPSFASRLSGKSFADPLIKNMQMGATFGLASGTLTELDRQQLSGKFDAQKLAWSALSRSGLDALAAAPGGLYGRRLAAAGSGLPGTEGSTAPKRGERSLASAGGNPLEPRTAMPEQPAANLRLPATPQTITFGRSLENLPLARGAREFIVTGGDFRPVVDQRRGAAQLTVQEIDGKTGRAIGDTQPMLLGHLDANTRWVLPSISPETRIASCNPQMLTDGLRPQHIFPSASGDVFLGAGRGNRITLATSISLLPSEAPIKLALGGEQPGPWRTVTQMLEDPLVLRDIAEQQTRRRSHRNFEPARIQRWAQELSGQKDLVPECALYEGQPYGYFLGGEQLTIPLQPLEPGHRYGPVLKLSTLDFRKSWGFREFPMGFKDIEVLDGPYRMVMRDGEFNHWYLQPRAESFGYHQMDVVSDFGAAMRAKGRYTFWDQKVEQFGFELDKNGEIKTDSKGREKIVVLDYNSISRNGSCILNPNEPRQGKR